ncbi:MazG family protein [Cellulomonas sp. zg-ZUI22]|uniref:MazG family protein n=1 Tax=Cellulomonas sp. zg-ZUI22 TaxID=2816955 RepID=UPI001A93F8FA|nr:MazG family protein [Cellulomonas sp. zg-ZUI22]MBO0901668.1 MazG family protein [Cellulomonas sp. zg-ZUI22]
MTGPAPQGPPAPQDPATSADVGRRAAALARVVEVMDRLRSPGGCPWYAEQTHASLLPYAVEEAHELVEAVEAGDRAGMREELGDLLLQVLVHARLASEDPDEPFDVGDVADALAAKLVRRNPHVFTASGDAEELDARAVDARWEGLKRAEKPGRTSVLDGVPASLGALARAQRLVVRGDRGGLLDRAAAPVASTAPGGRRDPDGTTAPVAPPATPEAVGDALLALVVAAHAGGVDAEAALRAATARWESVARDVEHRAAEHRPAEHRPAEHLPVEHRPVEH